MQIELSRQCAHSLHQIKIQNVLPDWLMLQVCSVSLTTVERDDQIIVNNMLQSLINGKRCNPRGANNEKIGSYDPPVINHPAIDAQSTLEGCISGAGLRGFTKKIGIPYRAGIGITGVDCAGIVVPKIDH